MRWVARAAALVFCAVVLLSSACIPGDGDDLGSVAALPFDEPVHKEFHGARLYLLRRADDDVLALWAVSPLVEGERGQAQCLVVRRSRQTFRGETNLFLDPCHSAWWSRDGRFLGYTGDGEDAATAGPSLVRIPTEMQDGRVVVEMERLRCLQNGEPECR